MSDLDLPVNEPVLAGLSDRDRHLAHLAWEAFPGFAEFMVERGEHIVRLHGRFHGDGGGFMVPGRDYWTDEEWLCMLRDVASTWPVRAS